MVDGLGRGERAPEFDLVAAGSARRFGVPDADGRRLVLVFHLQGTAQAAREINRAVRARYPSTEEVLVASVIDLSIVPPVYWMTVNVVLSNAYDQASLELPPEADPADYLIILPDWGGRVSHRYGARNTGRAAVAAVVDGDSNVVGSYQGGQPAEAVLELLASRE